MKLRMTLSKFQSWIFFTFVVGGLSVVCSAGAEKWIHMDKMINFERYLGKEVVVSGKALNAKEGAIVDGSHGMVFVRGLDKWPKKLYDKAVNVRGKLVKIESGRRRNDQLPTANPTGAAYYIDNYQIVQDRK